MEFEDRKAFERWLMGQSQQVCAAIASRAALRVWPVLSLGQLKLPGRKIRSDEKRLFSAHAIMLASQFARTDQRPGKQMHLLGSSRHDFAKSDDAATAAKEAAISLFVDSPHAWRTAAFRAVTASFSSEQAVTRIIGLTERSTYADASYAPKLMLSTPLWHQFGWPDGLALEDFRSTVLDTDPRFDFFRRWYDGMFRGTPMDWELQRRVALIPQEVWEAGADAVAGAIAEIEAAWQVEQQGVEPRRPEFEPRHVTHLFENKIIVSAGMSSLSATIRQEFEKFRAETGLNQTPEIFLPLEALPGRLDKISDILTRLERSAATEQELREEIGRLNALVAELEKKLAKAKADCEALQKSSWKKVAAWTVGGANLFGVLAAAVWTVSGDDVGAKQRLETLQEYREVLFGQGQPPVGP